MTTATNKCKKVRPDLLPYGTPVFMTHKGTECATTWASKACHSTGRVKGLDGVPMALSTWTSVNGVNGVNGVNECYVKRDGKRVYISTLRSEATAAGECISLDVEELETGLLASLQAENAALRAENKALKHREQTAIKCLIGMSA